MADATYDACPPSTAGWTRRPASSCWPPGALTRPTNAQDDPSGSQRRADALCELARRSLEAASSPTAAGPAQPAVLVDRDSSRATRDGGGGRPGRWRRRPVGGGL